MAALALLLTAAAVPSFAGNGWREARFDKRHPRRSEVMDRTGNINQTLKADRGNLDGHYGQLKREDQAIRRQQRRDARRNGGYITQGQQAQLNREENHLNNQIVKDQ